MFDEEWSRHSIHPYFVPWTNTTKAMVHSPVFFKYSYPILLIKQDRDVDVLVSFKEGGVDTIFNSGMPIDNCPGQPTHPYCYWKTYFESWGVNSYSLSRPEIREMQSSYISGGKGINVPGFSWKLTLRVFAAYRMWRFINGNLQLVYLWRRSYAQLIQRPRRC